TTSVCKNTASPNVIFTGANGIAPYTFTYKLNGGANQSITTVSGNAASLGVATGTTGAFAYTLVSVSDNNGCSQVVAGTATVTVNSMPSATITGTTSVCQNAASPNITFTGANGVAPYTFTYKINGGASQTIATTSGNTVAVSVATG